MKKLFNKFVKEPWIFLTLFKSMRIPGLCFCWLYLLLISPTYAQISPDFKDQGVISYYTGKFTNFKTASGEPFDNTELVGCHNKIPINSKVRVTNLSNGKSVIVTINHRGPYAWGRIMDVSKAAARKIGLISTGTTKARIEIVTSDQPDPSPVEAKPKELASQPGEEKNPDTPVQSLDFAIGKTYTQWGSVVAPGGYGVQVGGFSSLEGARNYCKSLREIGFDQEKIYIQVHEKNQNKFFKVVMGEFEKALDTTDLKAEFRQKTSKSCFTTKHFE